MKRAFRITCGRYQQPSECKVISLQSWGSPAAHWGTLGGLLPESCCCCRGRSGMGLRLLPITKIMMNNEPWLAPIGQEMSENSLVKHCRSNTCYYTPTLQPHQHSQTHMKTHTSDTIVPYLLCSLKPHGQLRHHGWCRHLCCCCCCCCWWRGFQSTPTARLQ